MVTTVPRIRKTNKLRLLTADDWESRIMELPKRFRVKIAVTVMWDYADMRGGRFVRTEFFKKCMEDYNTASDGLFTGDEIAIQLRKVGYLEKAVETKRKAINDLHSLKTRRNEKQVEYRKRRGE